MSRKSSDSGTQPALVNSIRPADLLTDHTIFTPFDVKNNSSSSKKHENKDRHMSEMRHSNASLVPHRQVTAAAGARGCLRRAATNSCAVPSRGALRRRW